MPSCSRCSLNERAHGQRWCQPCRTAWARAFRKPLSPEAKRRSNARAYLHVYLKRGKLSKGPCAICGSTSNIEAHHHDYSKPLDVLWLCRAHHLQLHHVEH